MRIDSRNADYAWYIELYCQYLTRNIKWQRNSYLFMDEAQDLSESELELIIKINSYTEEKGEFSIYHTPVVNLFGDVNQTITGHGINSWDLKTLKHNDYELKHNYTICVRTLRKRRLNCE